MTIFHPYKEIEKKLQQAARLMPKPKKSLPVLPIMAQKNQAKKTLWYTPAFRIAVIILLIFTIGSTTIFASNSRLWNAIARFFSTGVTEEIPIQDLESDHPPVPNDKPHIPSANISGKLSKDITKQTAGSLTLLQDVTLDSHFIASYASSPDNLTLIETPSGIPLFSTQKDDGKTTYYRITDGVLEEITLKTHTLTAAVQPKKLPGILSNGDTRYDDLSLPRMEFTVNWQQYGSDILIDDTNTEDRFDIGSTYGVDLGDEYDGAFFYEAIKGQKDIIQVFFCLDSQRTGYQYPFLLNLKTGEVSDPLSSLDLSAWACITDLTIQPGLATATARAGSGFDTLGEITVDLNTGAVTAETASAKDLPIDDYVTCFPVGKDTLFYITGTEENGNGYLYNTRTGESTLLFTDAGSYSMWGGSNTAVHYWQSIGYGYLVYYADHTVSLINLKDNGTMTVLEGIPMSRDINFFMNYEGTVLSISTHGDREDSLDTTCLRLLDLKTMEAWSFDRNLPEDVEETSNFWNGEYSFVIEAENPKNGMNYIYLYQYTPSY